MSVEEFEENSSGGSRTVPCGWTDMTKLIVAFCDWFATRLPQQWKIIKRPLIVPTAAGSNEWVLL